MSHSIDHPSGSPKENIATGVKSPRPWKVAIPLAAVILLCLAWSGYWWFVMGMSQKQFNHWIEQAKTEGVTAACGKLDWGGYPFRVEMSCLPLNLSWASPAGRGAISLGGLESVFEVYNPQHILAAISSPADYRIGAADATTPNTAISATFDPAIASIVTSGRDLDRTSFVVEKLITEIGGKNGVAAQGRARKLELHSRFVQPTEDQPIALDIAGDAEGVSVAGPAITDATGIPIELDRLSLRAQAVGAFVTTRNPSTALKAFAAGGGKVKITSLSAQSGKITLDATGEMTFDSKGRANGELVSDVVNLKTVFEELQQAGRLGEMEAAFSFNMLAMLEGATSGKEGSLRVKVIISKGDVYYGPFKIAELPPLF